MNDNLENFIRENRESFDSREPGDVWSSIEGKLPKNRNHLHWLWKAAAILFFATTVGLASHTILSQDGNRQFTASAESDAEFGNVEDFYFQQISEKRGLIALLQDDRTEGIEVVAELQKLDAMYQVLKEQYETDPTPEVIDALTLNLLVRIDLLNKTLEDLDQAELPTEI